MLLRRGRCACSRDTAEHAREGRDARGRNNPEMTVERKERKLVGRRFHNQKGYNQSSFKRIWYLWITASWASGIISESEASRLVRGAATGPLPVTFNNRYITSGFVDLLVAS